MFRIVLAVLMLVALPAAAGAVSGDLDPSFGTGGVVTFALPASGVEAAHIVALSDGRVVIAGTRRPEPPLPDLPAPPPELMLVRLLADGSLDPTFGTGGVVTTGVPGFAGNAIDLLRQLDGSLVVLGESHFSNPLRASLARFDADGALDETFGTAGVTTLDFPGGINDQIAALARQSDGNLIVVASASNASNRDFVVARVTSGGTLDATFGTGGFAFADFAADDLAYAVVVQPDDAIVVGGTTGGPHADLALARFTPNGTLDATFGTGGQVVTNPSGFNADEIRALVRQPDGALVAAGVTHFGSSFSRMVLARWNAGGTIDPGFGTGGVVYPDPSSSLPTAAYGLVLTPDGALVAAGLSGTPPPTLVLPTFMLTRLTGAGVLDPYFGGGGFVRAPDNGAVALAQRPDTTLVAVGRTHFNPTKLVAARYFGGQCGNPSLEPGEVCEDGNTTNGDGCDANCTPTGCGNGVETSGETCDDGNVADGDCCGSTCQLDAAGAFCVGDDLCANHACDGAGECTSEVVPALDCREPLAGQSRVDLRDGPKRKLAWQWKKGPATPLADFGDPTLDTDYAFCVYDTAAGTPDLVYRADVRACSACWRATKSGFAYKNKTADVITKMQLLASPADGKPRVTIGGSGGPAIDLSVLPMTQDPTVVVQLRNSLGKCWGANYGTSKQNDGSRFRAKSD